MLIDLVLTVCLVASPETCREERLTFESRGSQAQCMMLSSPTVAAWAGDHPAWKVTRWRCAWPEERKLGI